MSSRTAARRAPTFRSACHHAGVAWLAVVIGSLLFGTARRIAPPPGEGVAEVFGFTAGWATWVADVLTYPMTLHLMTVLASIVAAATHRVRWKSTRILLLAFTIMVVVVGMLPRTQLDHVVWLGIGVGVTISSSRRRPVLDAPQGEPSRAGRALLGAGLFGTVLGPVLIAGTTLFYTVTDPRAHANDWLWQTLGGYAFGGYLLMCSAGIGAVLGAIITPAQPPRPDGRG